MREGPRWTIAAVGAVAVLVGVVVLVAGATNGLAVVGTMALATAVEPATAVAANASGEPSCWDCSP